jgi:hypothetical protein
MSCTQKNYLKQNIDNMKLVNEIKEIKRLIKLIENVDETNSNVMVIGDNFAIMLQGENVFKNSNLISPRFTVNSLSDAVSEEQINTEIDEIFISVGSNELFNPNQDISGLVYNLNQVYPNARLHLIKGYVNANKLSYDTDEIEEIKNDSILFFNLFKKDNVKIVGEEVTGKFDVIGYDIVKSTSNYIEKINQYIYRFVIESDFDLDDVDVSQTVTFTDMDVDDQTDFDTIYEFLEIFEKITKSNNTYDISLSSKYLGEVEIIQIALSFLGFGNIPNNGHYDENTAESIEMFQSQNQLKVNGKADKNTLTELLWELKGRGFEDDDLAKFIKSLDIIEKEYPIDSYNLEDYCDKVIDNFEGGYANKVHFQDSANNEKDPDMKAAIQNSSETMLGIDRMAGNWDSDPVGSDFWQLVDDNSGWAPESAGKPKWSHGYMGGSIEGQLRSYVYEMMIPRFESLKDQYLSSESKKLVEEDKRLTMHLLYAVWNGSGFFQDFADVIDSEVSSGNTDRDSLYEIAIDSRVHNGNGAIAKVGNKVKNVIDSL